MTPSGPCITRAIPLLALGRASEAEATIRVALQRRQDDPAALGQLGAVLIARGRIQEAEAAYRHALAFAPNQIELLGNLAELLGAQGRTSEAIDFLVKATGLAPNNGDIWGRYGMALARAGNLNRASEVFTYARQRGDQSPVSRYEAIGVLIARHRWPEAVAALRQALLTMSEVEIDPFQRVLSLPLPGPRGVGEVARLRPQARGPLPPAAETAVPGPGGHPRHRPAPPRRSPKIAIAG